MKLLLLFFFFLSFTSAQTDISKEQNLDASAYIIAGDSLNKRKDYNGALKLYELGLAKSLDNNENLLAAKFYKKIGVYHHTKGTYELAESLYKKGLVLDSLTNNAADLYFNISLVKETIGEQDSVLNYLEGSLNILDNTVADNSAKSNIFLYAGRVYKDLQLYEISLNYLIKAYNGYTSLKNDKKLADVCSVLGNIHNHIHNYNQARYYYNQALKLQGESKSLTGKGRTYINIANTFHSLKEYDSAVFYYNKGIKLLKPQSLNLASAKYNLADTYVRIGKTDAAEIHFKESIQINRSLKDTLSLLYDYNGIVSLYLTENKLNEAKKYIDSLSVHAVKVSDKIITLNYLENRAEYFQKTKNYQEAYTSLIQFKEIYKIIFDSQQNETIQSLHARFDHSNKNNEILKLKLANRDKELVLLEQSKNIKSKNLLLISIILICIILGVSYYFYRIRQENIKQGLKIDKLTAVYSGQEEIKKLIARDLHDIITTNYDGLRLRILALKKVERPKDEIDKITKELKDINQQIRIVSHRLSPLDHIIGNRKFTDIIKSRLSEFQLYSKVFVELENEIPESLNDTTAIFQDNFYGILLEILNNIEKHSKANKLTIDYFVDEEKQINIVFRDNGIGINKKSKDGVGLLNIKQRCEILSGLCQIKKVESGTEVQLVFSAKNIFKNEAY
ncbi:tetratricopeptide repeat-containing sensor histidine kinase [Seonamhaeicola marinus]|uniref:tetratricopeptide repeat-containing sensor histidine kinase n=1 Tax=Seonamhaeicola marinus TaxID=1912246 RepID=UPI001651C86A|nr:tetratricopeptide repeat protein [Seonamhaeicola marinus]